MPDMPGTAHNARPFECPYCHKIVTVTNTHAWMRHVYRDLQPYVCTFEQCATGEETYESRHRWFNHEVQCHRRVWSCPGHCEEVFQDSDSFEAHVRDHNEQDIPTAQLKTFVDMAARHPDRLHTKSECPLCALPVVGATSLEKHLGRHLESLALFALPQLDSDSISASESEDSYDSLDSASQNESQQNVQIQAGRMMPLRSLK